MFKLFKVVLIALIFSVMIFTGCKKNKAPAMPSTPAGPTSGGLNTEYSFTSSAEDPDDDSVAIRFIWGDGDTSNWSAFVPSGDSVSMSCSWSDTNSYIIKAQAEDLHEAVSSWSGGHQIIIGNPPNTPTTPAGDSIGLVNVTYSFISTATDPNGDSIAIRFDWGDGDTSNWSSFVPSGNSIPMSHSWSDSGLYSIKAQAKDLKEAVSSWSGGHQIIIGRTMPNNPPNTPVTPFGDSIGSTNVSYSFISTATDPDGDSVAIRFDWGDGDTSNWSAYKVLDTVIIGHSWTNSGTYSVKAQAKDKKGATSYWSAGHQIEISAGWIKTFGGSEDDYGNSVDITSDGGYIIAGYTKSFGGLAQVYLIKTDSSGDTMWTKTKGFSDCDDWGNAVQQNSEGGYVIVGRTHEASTDAIYMVITDANGATQHYAVKGYDNYDDVGCDVQQISDGYILVGWTYGSGNGDVWLIRTDADGGGTGDWKFGGSAVDLGYSVKQTTDGGYIIAGWTRSYSAGESDVYLIRTGAGGGFKWSCSYGGTMDDVGRSVQQTSDGGYIITGWTLSYGAGNSDVYLIKTDTSGVPVWSKTFGGSGWDDSYSVQQTSDGGYIIVGSTNSYGAGNSDVYLIKTNASGTKTWEKTFGGSGNDVGYSVQQTTDGGYIITGSTESTGTGKDVYLIKTDANGNVK